MWWMPLVALAMEKQKQAAERRRAEQAMHNDQVQAKANMLAGRGGNFNAYGASQNYFNNDGEQYDGFDFKSMYDSFTDDKDKDDDGSATK